MSTPTHTTGTLITFEGGEGCGKSTQLARVAARLEAAGARVRSIREPGGTPVGEVVRELLLDPAHDGMDQVTELLLYEASRAQLVADVIAPAIAAGEVVLCDRFTDSTLAYQGYGRGLPLSLIAELNAAATDGVRPARTVLLDLDVDEGLRRATAVATDRLEGLDPAFHQRVRAGFLELAAREPDRMRVVEASGTPDRVADRVLAALADVPALEPYLGGALGGPA